MRRIVPGGMPLVEARAHKTLARKTEGGAVLPVVRVPIPPLLVAVPVNACGPEIVEGRPRVVRRGLKGHSPFHAP